MIDKLMDDYLSLMNNLIKEKEYGNENLSNTILAEILKYNGEFTEEIISIQEEILNNFIEKNNTFVKNMPPGNTILLSNLVSLQKLMHKFILEVTTIELPHNDKNNILIRLLVKGERIFKEIIILIQNGYYDGALSRWRSLYETAVICSFLGESDSIVSERFLEHSKITQYYKAKDFNKYSEELSLEKFSSVTLRKMLDECESVILKYGYKKTRGYVNEYAWVDPKINNTFSSITKKVDLDWLKPYYSYASSKIHQGESREIYSYEYTDKTDLAWDGHSYEGIETITSICSVIINIMVTNFNGYLTKMKLQSLNCFLLQLNITLFIDTYVNQNLDAYVRWQRNTVLKRK